VSPSNIGASLEAISTAGVDGLIVTDDPVFQSIQEPLIAFAAERGLPAVWGLESGPLRGALMSYHSNVFALGERAARYVDHILKGVSPSDLPVEQASDFILRINLRLQKHLASRFSGLARFHWVCNGRPGSGTQNLALLRLRTLAR
jgi:putative tryptophan/tyrosine transport system substrate-binding protein